MKSTIESFNVLSFSSWRSLQGLRYPVPLPVCDGGGGDGDGGRVRCIMIHDSDAWRDLEMGRRRWESGSIRKRELHYRRDQL